MVTVLGRTFVCFHRKYIDYYLNVYLKTDTLLRVD